MLRKIQATRLFDGQRFWEDQVLVINPDGSIADLLPSTEAGEGVERFDGFLSPGFINCHCHLELSHLRGKIEPFTGLPAFLSAVMQQAPPDPLLQQEAIEKADAEMRKNGIVAVGDICNTIAGIEYKKRSSLLYYNFIETMGLVDEGATARFQSALRIRDEHIRQLPGSAGNAVVPHAPYSLGKKMAELIFQLPDNHLLSIHSQESTAEEELFRTATGDFIRFYQSLKLPVSPFAGQFASGLELTLSLLRKTTPLILVHNVETSRTDLALANAASTPLYWCLCPGANEYISQKLPDIPLLCERTEQLVLGTDSLASNHSLDLLSEIRVIKKQFPNIPLEKMLRWATLNGARALQIDDRMGSFEPGKKPGVLLIANHLNEVTRLI